MLMNDFWENQLESGYYDKILTKGKQKNSGIQSNWHNLTFQKISAYLKKEDVHIDYACGPGSFIGLYSISKSIGLDISMKQINYAKYSFFPIINPLVISLTVFFESVDKALLKSNERYIAKNESSELFKFLKVLNNLFFSFKSVPL